MSVFISVYMAETASYSIPQITSFAQFEPHRPFTRVDVFVARSRDVLQRGIFGAVQRWQRLRRFSNAIWVQLVRAWCNGGAGVEVITMVQRWRYHRRARNTENSRLSVGQHGARVAPGCSKLKQFGFRRLRHGASVAGAGDPRKHNSGRRIMVQLWRMWCRDAPDSSNLISVGLAWCNGGGVF